MTVSVIIPAYNGLEFIKSNLDTVLALKAGEVIVVDDASTDGTAGYITRNYPLVKVIALSQNVRFPKAVNLGVKKASGDIIVLLNQDVKPESDLLKSVLPHFSQSGLFAVTFHEQKYSWASAHINQGMLEFSDGTRDNRIHASFWASGAGSAFRKSMWRELGGFDESLTPGYYEDLDLGWRAHKRGYNIIWDPEAKISHIRETAYPKAFPAGYLHRIKERNFLLVQWKNLDRKYLLSHISSLISRVTHHPGFLVPALMAVVRLPQVLIFRNREKKYIRTADDRLFTEFSRPQTAYPPNSTAL
ncbi:MAG: Glycosyl transferase, family 2 [Candidatus Amesbacteria bacterium GW2011_GWB1_47_19]|nr:MAG: Glycosyl transferase, family 2 [Candidatus Amesbacteria bacterium GW2011_GWA1_44_24]KKU31405.1 MAG: Glycosyl transferase, family 2 [Candidatus Amesbacteria bacterium GW2011_GWC1_46_24]KKU66943.1 MAG: Glycosyl transferase, family 2 [Candidatus Amesbacteria bacterium GW2011_GWB1_47_19]OGD06435.1 MAG: hypothetical protein A2379_02235 [Candidatus Amesbacteria bacterium RIFOXYB1_FULL_47_13]